MLTGGGGGGAGGGGGGRGGEGGRGDPRGGGVAGKSIAGLMYPSGVRLNFSIHQSGVDFKCPFSNRSLNPLTPLNRLWQGLVSDTKDLEILEKLYIGFRC